MSKTITEEQLREEPEHGDEANINSCGRCQARLALRRPTAAVAASPWRCRRCDAVFLASPQLRDGRRFSAGARAAFYFDLIGEPKQRLPAGAAGISPRDECRLRRCLTRPAASRPEARRHRRFSVLAAVTLIPLASDLRIVEVPSAAIAVNVSAGGLAIVNGKPLSTPFFAVDFSQSHATLPPVVLAQVRTRQLGEAYEIAGSFVSRIEY